MSEKKGRVMAISGTSRGIGRGVAEFFIGEGYRVAGCSRGPSTISLEGYLHEQIDVGSEQDVIRWVRSIKKAYGRIDVAICNAALATSARLFTITPGQILEPLVQTNICGTFYVCREATKVMLGQKSGSVIALSSMALGLLEEGTSAYSASKSAVVAMTKILAKELAPLGVTCNVIAPSMVMTEAVAALGQDVIERALGKLTIKRQISIEEVCNVIAFLVAPASRCITGQVIHMGLVN
jgi:3-oxoacyl-[acyl-carrier protein] reductase